MCEDGDDGGLLYRIGRGGGAGGPGAVAPCAAALGGGSRGSRSPRFSPPRHRKLPELMADHSFGDLPADMNSAIVNQHGGADELGQNGGPSRPDFPVREALPLLLQFEKEGVHEAPLP